MQKKNSEQLYEWLSQRPEIGCRVLVTNQTGNGNRLIRGFNRKNKANTIGEISCKSLVAIAVELINASRTWSSTEELSESFTPDGTQLSVLRMDGIIRKKLNEGKLKLLHKDSLCFETSQEVLKQVNQLRSHKVDFSMIQKLKGLTGFDKTSEKLKDLLMLKKEYEEDMKKTDKPDQVVSMDEIQSLIKGTDLLRDFLDSKEGKQNLNLLLPWLANCRFGVPENYRMTPVEHDFLEKLSEASGTEWKVLTYLPDKIDVEDKKKKGQEERMEFFKAYGAVNEVREVISRIQENAKIHYGDAAIYYTAPEYENILIGELEKEKIPYCMTGECHAASSEILQQILAILRFAIDDFSYQELENVIMNPCMYLRSKAEEKQDVMLEPDVQELKENGVDLHLQEIKQTAENTKLEENEESHKEKPIRAYQDILNINLSWGIERYRDYLKDPSKYRKEFQDQDYLEKYPLFKDFLDVLMNHLFLDEKVLPERPERYFFDELLDFVKLYSVRNKKTNYVLKTLWQKRSEYIVAEDSWWEAYDRSSKASFKELYQKYEKLFSEQTYQEAPSNEAVSVIRFCGYDVLDRKHNYFIGLSASQFSASLSESPIFSDKEIEAVIPMSSEEQEYLSGPELALERNSLLRQYFDWMVFTSDEDMKITMSYPYFDTVNLRECAGSVTFLEYADDKKVDQVSKYTLPLDPAFILPESLSDVGITDASVLEEPIKSTEISSSSIQDILKCPLVYYYDKDLHAKKLEFKERSPFRWMDSAGYGNLFHRVLKDYCDYLDKKNEFIEVDSEKLNEIFHKHVKRMEVEFPVSSEAVKEREIENAKKTIDRYVKWFHKERLASLKYQGLKFIGNELEFGKDKLLVRHIMKHDHNGEETITLDYRGSIDRLMGRRDPKNKKRLLLHLTDYKTGNKEWKEKEIDEGTQIQHLTYALAALFYCKNNKSMLQKKFCIKGESDVIEEIQFERIDYEFPYWYKVKDENAAKANDKNVDFSEETQIEDVLELTKRAFRFIKDCEVTTNGISEMKTEEDVYKLSDEVPGFDWMRREKIKDEAGGKKGEIIKHVPLEKEANIWAVFAPRQNGRSAEMHERIQEVMDDMDQKEPKWKENRCKFCSYTSICRRWI